MRGLEALPDTFTTSWANKAGLHFRDLYRLRDYVDLYTLTGKQAVSYESVRSALDATTRHRGVDVQPLSAVIEFVDPLAGGAGWAAWDPEARKWV